MVSTTATGGSNDVATALGGMSKSLGAIQMTGDMISTTLTLFKDAFKPVMAVVSAILKLINLLVMPFTNLLIPLLLPIIYLLAPMAKFLNMIMRPVYQSLMMKMKERSGLIKTATVDLAQGFKKGDVDQVKEGVKIFTEIFTKDIADVGKVLGGAMLTSIGDPLGKGKSLMEEGFKGLISTMDTNIEDTKILNGKGADLKKDEIETQKQIISAFQGNLKTMQEFQAASEAWSKTLTKDSEGFFHQSGSSIGFKIGSQIDNVQTPTVQEQTFAWNNGVVTSPKNATKTAEDTATEIGNVFIKKLASIIDNVKISSIKIGEDTYLRVSGYNAGSYAGANMSVAPTSGGGAR